MSAHRSAWACALLGICLSGIAIVYRDARTKQTQRAQEHHAVLVAVRFLPAPDLSLAPGARHLRFVSLEEPGAAFADRPAAPDADPAGGAIAPPRAIWIEQSQGHHSRTSAKELRPQPALQGKGP